jgi:hypothetical protein
MLATIQHKEYFRASKLGEGSFGSVITVYDEDGGEFACKVFDQCEDEGDEDEDEEWEEGGGTSGLDVGVLRGPGACQRQRAKVSPPTPAVRAAPALSSGTHRAARWFPRVALAPRCAVLHDHA